MQDDRVQTRIEIQSGINHDIDASGRNNRNCPNRVAVNDFEGPAWLKRSKTSSKSIKYTF